MSEDDFHVEGIDHIQHFVSDQNEAAQWFEQVLGFEICSEYEKWAEEDGPLMISSDEGRTKLALFDKPVDHPRATSDHHIAFRIDGPGFLEFVDRAAELPVLSDNGQSVEREDIVDYDMTFSVFFRDLDGNRCEVTTYDYEFVASTLTSGHQQD